MLQIDQIVRGEAKSFKVQISTVYGPLDLGGYESCGMYLYDNEDFSTPILSWESSDATRAIFFDRSKGMVQFFIKNQDTDPLEPKQYPYRMKVQKDSNHTYTFHQGIIEIKE